MTLSTTQSLWKLKKNYEKANVKFKISSVSQNILLYVRHMSDSEWKFNEFFSFSTPHAKKSDTEEFNKYYFHSRLDFQRNFYVLKATLYFSCRCGLDMKLWLIFWNVFLSLICSEIINFIFCALLWLALQAVDRNVRKIEWLSFKRQIKARESYKLANLPWKWSRER